jgi:cob(I)alamin adenosyltransferase
MAIRINRVYTRTGDQGDTGLVGGHRIGKDDLRIECYGTVDELNATLGLARLHSQPVPGAEGLAELDAILGRVQSELFNLGSLLATRAQDLRPTQPVIHDHHISRLENEIDRFNEHLPELRSFVLPGGGSLGAYLHLCRTVCRRAERLTVSLARRETVPPEAVQYLNRLSDALFVFARHAARVTGTAEVLWQPETT